MTEIELQVFLSEPPYLGKTIRVNFGNEEHEYLTTRVESLRQYDSGRQLYEIHAVDFGQSIAPPPAPARPGHLPDFGSQLSTKGGGPLTDEMRAQLRKHKETE